METNVLYYEPGRQPDRIEWRARDLQQPTAGRGRSDLQPPGPMTDLATNARLLAFEDTWHE
ncbi:MAG: hypothetical protein WD402_09390 [Chloroflexota bacterium]